MAILLFPEGERSPPPLDQAGTGLLVLDDFVFSEGGQVQIVLIGRFRLQVDIQVFCGHQVIRVNAVAPGILHAGLTRKAFQQQPRLRWTTLSR